MGKSKKDVPQACPKCGSVNIAWKGRKKDSWFECREKDCRAKWGQHA